MLKRLIFLIVTGVFCMSCSSKSNLAATNGNNKLLNDKEFGRISLQDSMINYGMKYMATPYRYGGTTTRGFDCSGFTSYVFNQFGYNLNRSSRDQAKQFPSVSKNELQTGDLVFFEGRSHNGKVGHVGIVTERKTNGEFDFLHASVNRGVTISSSGEPYYALRYLKGGRVVENSNDLSFSKKQSISGNKSSVNTARKNAQPTEQKNMYDAIYHTVKKGESLAKLSKEYDVPISTIQHLNDLKSKKIKKGQKLLISEAVSMPDLPAVAVQSIRADEIFTTQKNQDTSVTIADVELVQPVKTEPKRSETKGIASPETLTQAGTAVNSGQKTAQEKTEVKTVDLTINQQPSVNQSNRTEKHTVSAGETLYSIARMYSLSVNEMKQLNNLTSNTINAGQVLVVGTPEVQTAEIRQATPAISETNITHTVQRGETLYSIARQYNLTVAAIKKWNSYLSDNIRVGDKIKIVRK